jgi:hydroxypyruvate isomerase
MENKELTAKEAREIAANATLNSTNKALEEINKSISDACEKGELYVWHYKSITSDLKTRLESIGYKVEINHESNETLVKISWEV